MNQLPDQERGKLDSPLESWYADSQRQPTDRVYVLIKCHAGSEDEVDQLVESNGGTLRGRGTLVRAMRAQVDHTILGLLARNTEVVNVQMVHRSSEFNVSPYVAQSE